MCSYTGWIVRSTAGHDKGGLFCVAGTDQEGQRLLLVNGRQRKLSSPKRKQLGHVEPVSRGDFDHPVIHSLQQGGPVSDRALRRALAAFKEGSTLGER